LTQHESGDSRRFAYVQRSLVEIQAGWGDHARLNDDPFIGLPVTVTVRQCYHSASTALGNEQHASRADGHETRPR
jgi:hypothetical protein